MQPSETIRSKRDGGALSSAQINDFVQGLVNGQWADSQAAALAMAIVLRGMNTLETVALTQAMTHSGAVLNWQAAAFNGPVLDKHSTGGVGDKVSLLLAPILAACGAVVPMISGRGLGHTGGTLDKLEALPGYTVDVPHAQLLRTLQTVGCAIVGRQRQPGARGPALVRAARPDGHGGKPAAHNGQHPEQKARCRLARPGAGREAGQRRFHGHAGASAGAGTQPGGRGAWRRPMPARALITDMNQVLGFTAGNGLEVQESIHFLTGQAQEPRLLELTLALAAELLQMGGLAATRDEGRTLAQRSLLSGAAAERFAQMVAALGGPRDVLADAQLPVAPVQRAVPAPRAGVLVGMDVRALGQVVVDLGGGRSRPSQAVDPRVGLASVLPLHTPRSPG